MDFQGKAKELFPTGKSPDPSILKLSNDSFVLGKDSQSVIIETNGELIQRNPIKWLDFPAALGKLTLIISKKSVEYLFFNLHS